MSGKEGAAAWLFSSKDLHLSLKSQFDTCLADNFAVFPTTATEVINEFIEAGLEGEVIDEYFATFLNLVRSSQMRSWVINILIRLCQPKPYFAYMMTRGYVETLFSGMIKFRVHGTYDVLSQLFELEATYNTTLILHISTALNELLQAAIHTKTEFQPLILSSFTIEHVDNVKILHNLICDEIESGKLTDKENDLMNLLADLPKLLINMKTLHNTYHSSVEFSLSEEVDSLLRVWQLKLDGAARSAETRNLILSTSQNPMEVENPHSNGLIARRLPYLRHTIGGGEIEILIKPLWTTIDMNIAVEETEKLFVVPITATLQSLQKAFSNFFSRLIHLVYVSKIGESYLLSTQEQLQSLLLDAEQELKSIPGRKVPLIRLQAKQALPGEVTFENAVTILQPRETELLKVQQVAQTHGIKINANFMSEVYTFFESKQKSEIDIEDFVMFMRETLGVSEGATRPLFRAFDTDSSGTLSLSEIAIGLALLVEGSEDDRIIAAFNSYDADRSGNLDYEELSNLVSVVKGVDRAKAQYFTQYAYHFLNLPIEARINLDQFITLVKSHELPLEYLLPDIRQKYYAKLQPQFRTGTNGMPQNYLMQQNMTNMTYVPPIQMMSPQPTFPNLYIPQQPKLNTNAGRMSFFKTNSLPLQQKDFDVYNPFQKSRSMGSAPLHNKQNNINKRLSASDDFIESIKSARR
jgi:Ca2+-binding EF-hand superfamily protein